MPPTRPDRHRPGPPPQPAQPTKAQPPRPPNAWILYRSDKLRELAQNQPPGPRKPQAEISKIISQMWSSEGPETKGMYEARAEEKKAEHAALYPDYKFAPMKKEDKAMLRKAQRQEKEDLKAAERSRKKRKGKGRADEDEDDDRPFVNLPYPLARPAQPWYPPSTYGPQQPYPRHPSPRVPPPPLPSHLQSSYSAAGWSAPVDPEDTPFRADAYQQQEREDEWNGEEGEWNNEEAFAGRPRRDAVWGEDISGQPDEEQQDDPVAQWTSIPNSPPQQPELLTVTLPATIGPSEQPYTFNLEFDVPMASFAGDPDAQVALSINNMSLNQSSSSQGLLHVPGLNDLLEAPLPDIDVSFAENDGGFDVLSGENEEWWAALMDAALMGNERPPAYGEAGPSNHAGSSNQAASEPAVVSQLGLDSSTPSSSRGPRPAPLHTHSLPTFSHGLPSPDGEGSYPMPGGYPEEQPQSEPQSAYPQQATYPPSSYSHSYPEQYQQPAEYQQEYQQGYIHPSPFAQIASSRSGQSATWRQPQQQPAAPQPQPQPQQTRSHSQQQSRPAPAPQPHRKSVSGRRPTFPNGANAFPSPSGAGQFPSPSGAAQFPSPSGVAQFPSPSGAAPLPSPSGAMSYHRPAPPPPFFKPKPKPNTKEEKDPEAFDFSGWGNQYAVQPPTPAEDQVRRGMGVSAVSH